MRSQVFTAAAITMLMVGGAHADMLKFDFSFSNTSGNTDGTVSGNVTVDTATSRATSVFVTSFPSALGLTVGPTFNFVNDSFLNTFGVSNGEINFVFFVSSFSTTSFSLTNGGSGLFVDSNYVTNESFPTFTAVSNVPLPSSAPMFGAALLALGAVGYGMKRKKAAAAA